LQAAGLHDPADLVRPPQGSHDRIGYDKQFFDLQALQGFPHFPGHSGAKKRFRQGRDADLPDLFLFLKGIQPGPEMRDLGLLHIENLVGRGNRLLPDKGGLPGIPLAEFGLFIERELIPQGLLADLQDIPGRPLAPVAGVQQIGQEGIEGNPSAGDR